VQALPIVASLVRSRAFWPRPLQIVNRFEDGKLDVPGTPTVVRTPGHTVGHVSFHFPDRDVLIAGDAIVTLDPYTAQRGPRLVARAATADVERAARSLDALAETNAKTVLPGHGEPWREGVGEAAELARKAGAA
jgi:glyoxylase-like metal-dependent hydrolase (beta-lactamase superfamily II)